MPDPKKTMVKVLKTKPATAKNIEFTKNYTDSQDVVNKNISTNQGKEYAEKIQGIDIDEKQMAAKPIYFKRKVIKTGGENGMTKILSEDGKSVKYEGRSNMKNTIDALNQNEKQEKDTNSRREYNSNYFNVSSGAKKDLDDKDKASLIKSGKAVLKK